MHPKLGNTGIYLYDIFGIIGYIPLIIFSFNKKRIEDKSKFLGSVSMYFYQYYSLSKKENKRSSLYYWAKKENTLMFCIQIISFTFAGEILGPIIGKRTDIYGYLLATPILIYSVCALFGVNPLKQLDALTPSSAFIVSFLKISCFLDGCCSGLECSWGFFNKQTGRYEFPIQLLELVIYFLIFLFVINYKCKVPQGRLYPIYVIIYSLLRFTVQFFRVDEKIFLAFDVHQIICLITILLYLLWLYIIVKYENKITHRFKTKIRIKRIEERKEKHFSRKKHKKR